MAAAQFVETRYSYGGSFALNVRAAGGHWPNATTTQPIQREAHDSGHWRKVSPLFPWKQGALSFPAASELYLVHRRPRSGSPTQPTQAKLIYHWCDRARLWHFLDGNSSEGGTHWVSHQSFRRKGLSHFLRFWRPVEIEGSKKAVPSHHIALQQYRVC